MENSFFKFPVSIDPVIFSIIDGEINLLLLNRETEPFKGYWSLPGGLLKEVDASLEDGLERVLSKKTGAKTNYLEQVYTRTGHDTRGPTVSIAYMALVHDQSLKSNVKWFPVKKALELKLAFDHGDIIEMAVNRLTNKVNYSTLPMYFLGDKFTLPELQKVYEIVLGESLDKSTFRKKIEETGMLYDTGEYVKQGAFRPSKLYGIADSVKEVFTFKKNLF